MQRNVIKYLIIALAIVGLTVTIINYNYRYYDMSDKKHSLLQQVARNQELINNRNYLNSLLYAAENLIEIASANDLKSITKKLPKYLANSDLLLPTNTQWRYKNLHKLLMTFADKQSAISLDYQNRFKQNILLELTAFKSDFEVILKDQQKKQLELVNNLSIVNDKLEDLVTLNAALLLLLLSCLYYLIYSIKFDNRFKLHQLSNRNGIDTLVQKCIKDNFIEIEHICQRINYHNGLIKKQLLQKEKIIQQMEQDYSIVKEVVALFNSKANNQTSLNTSLNVPFKTYAKAVEVNKKFDNNFNQLRSENQVINKQLTKIKKYIKVLFYTSQKIATNIDNKADIPKEELSVTHQD